MYPKPVPRTSQACPICKRSFRAPKALYRHALKCTVGKKDRLGSRAKKSIFGEYLFDSRLERDLFSQLKFREIAGELRDIRVKPNVRITLADILVIPDFSAVDVKTSLLRYHEAKGVKTEKWNFKMRLWKFYGPAPIDVYVAGARGPAYSHTIETVLGLNP